MSKAVQHKQASSPFLYSFVLNLFWYFFFNKKLILDKSMSFIELFYETKKNKKQKKLVLFMLVNKSNFIGTLS